MLPIFNPILEKHYLQNPGYLKLDLMIKGVRLDNSIYRYGKILPEYKLSSHLFGNLDLILPQRTFVSVPYQEESALNSPYRLRCIRHKYYLTRGHETISVKVVPHPTFYAQRINADAKVGDVLACHGNYVSMALGGHRFLQPSLYHEEKKELELSVDEVIAVLERVRKDRKVKVVSLATGNLHDEDGGLSKVEAYVKAIKSSFNVLVVLECFPPKTSEGVIKSQNLGADFVCYHLGKVAHHKVIKEGRSQFNLNLLERLKEASSLFVPGTFLAHITIGGESSEEVIETIHELTQLKILPLLTLDSLKQRQEMGVEKLAFLFEYAYRSAKKHNILMKGFPKLAPFIIPIEGRLFVERLVKLKRIFYKISESKLVVRSVVKKIAHIKRKLLTKLSEMK